jgi:phenylacetate-CoA ligase
MSLEDRLYPLLGLYQRMPQGLRSSIGAVYRLLPASVKWGRSYVDFRRQTLEIESWDPEEVREYQFRQLKRTLNNAANFCPFYHQRFLESGFNVQRLRGPEDMENCPLLEKKDLVDNLDDLVSTDIPRRQRLYITTGGSTGTPVGFYLQKGVSRPREQAYLEAMWRRTGYEDGDRLVVVRGHVTDSRSAGRIDSYDPTRDWLMLSSYHLTLDRLDEYLEAIENFRPDILHIYPSAALILAEYLEKTRQQWRTPLKCVLCGSERLTLPQKRLLEKTFGCRVYRWYGHSERVVLAGEGRESEFFYFFPTYGLVEFGPEDEAGFREVIGTSFHNMAMPLIRYRTGDYVRLLDGPGERELFWPTVTEVSGREQEFLISGSGRRISLTAFNMHSDIFDGLYAVQFYQDSPGFAEFRYLPTPQFDRSRLDEILRGITEKLGDDFRVELKEVGETEKTSRGKHRWVVQKLDPLSFS